MAGDEHPRGDVSSSKKAPAARPGRPTLPVLVTEDAVPEVEWEGGAAKRTLSFYHAEGAPYLNDDGKLYPFPPEEEITELTRQGLVIPPTLVTEIIAEVLPLRDDAILATIYPVKAPGLTPASAGPAANVSWWRRSPKAQAGAPPLPSAQPKKALDLSIIEELAFLAMKKMFPEGVRIPIRRPGIADLDIIIQGKEITIDFNTLVGEVPRLAVWRVTFAYQGTPLAVWGRGVKGDFKVHLYRVTRFLIRAWWDKRKLKRQMKRQLKRESAG